MPEVRFTVPVPASVLEVFASHKIAYQVASAPAQGAPAVKALVLGDKQGPVQLLLPADSLADLAAIKRQFGRDLYALNDNELKMLLGSDLKQCPAIPGWRGLPTLVESSLLNYEQVRLDIGGEADLIELQSNNFRLLTRGAAVGELSAKAPTIASSPSGDEAQILDSIKNFTTLRIRQRLADTLELPPLPATADRIIRLRANPEADISDLTEIIELDPSLAAQVVSWAASPYYSAPGNIKSVQDAIVRVLGFDMVMNLALGLALSKTINTSAMSRERLTQYWRQAVLTAATIEGLVTNIKREHRPAFGLSYLSGLLGNFGQLILAQVFPPYFASIDRHVKANSHLPPASVEQHLIGVASCQLSSWLLDNWSMPEEVTTAIRHQNAPDYQGEHAPFANVLAVAQQLLINKGAIAGQYRTVPAATYLRLQLPRDTAEITVENILESCDELNSLANLMQG